jgi:hypothetical protein
MKTFKLRVSRGRFCIQAHVQEIGRDVLVSLWGGNRPHIGAIGMATPRPSLKDPKKWSATSSNFTYVGHKEDSVVKMISEKLASRLKTHIVVVAGIHWDNIRPEEIEIIQDLTRKLGDQILNRFGRPT